MSKARGYVRVSTDEQAIHGASIEAQQQKLQAYATFMGYDDFAIYTDEGFSGKNLHRPAVKQLLDEVAQGGIDAVVVWRIDRLSRSLRDMLGVVEDILAPQNTSLVSITESIDTGTPSGRLMLNVLASFAQSEREAGQERVKMTLNSLAHKCRHLGGPVLLGYKVVDGYYQLDEHTAPIVRHCFEMYLAHMGYTEILRYLAQEGIKTSQGREMTKTSLNFLFANAKYAGIYTHNRRAAADKYGHRNEHKLKASSEIIRIPGGMPAIITMDEWEQVQQIRAEASRKCSPRNRTPDAPALLSGLCRCSVCGSTMVMDRRGYDKDGTPQRYYKCKSKCVKPARKEDIEYAVIAILTEIAAHEDVIRQACAVADTLAAPDPAQLSEITRLQSIIIGTNKRLASITEYITAAGANAPATLLDEIHRLESDRSKLQATIDTLSAPPKSHDAQAIINRLQAIQNAKQLPPQEAKRLLQAAVACVRVSSDDYAVILTGLDSGVTD